MVVTSAEVGYQASEVGYQAMFVFRTLSHFAVLSQSQSPCPILIQKHLLFIPKST